jgi:hypothetical protein
MKGTLISLKENLFKQDNKISKKPIYPMFLNELQIIKSLKIELIE